MIRLEASEWLIDLMFPSDVTFVDHAIEILRTMLRYRGVRDSAALLVVSRELLKNAVVHGNRNSRSLLVRLRVTDAGPGPYRIDVEDQGSGFDTRVLTAPATLATRSPASPRGYEIIRAYACELSFSERGNRVSAWIEAAR